jgi:hypothetical protein
MMDRDTVQSEENQAGLRRQDLPMAYDLLRRAGELRALACEAHRKSIGLSDEFGEFWDDLAEVILRFEKAIEGDR